MYSENTGITYLLYLKFNFLDFNEISVFFKKNSYVTCHWLIKILFLKVLKGKI